MLCRDQSTIPQLALSTLVRAVEFQLDHHATGIQETLDLFVDKATAKYLEFNDPMIRHSNIAENMDWLIIAGSVRTSDVRHSWTSGT